MTETRAPLRSSPACGSNQRREQSSKNGFQLCSCRACNTLYTSRLPDSTTHERYAGYYDVENLSVPEFLLKGIADIVAGFSRYRKTNRLLEVGFGAATTFEAARKANWETNGIKVSSRAIEHARQLGFDVFEGELQKAKYPAAHFDVVVASEILEHVPDPSLLAEEIRRVLRPGGMLWATTPNVHSLSGRLLKQNWSAVCPPPNISSFFRERELPKCCGPRVSVAYGFALRG